MSRSRVATRARGDGSTAPTASARSSRCTVASITAVSARHEPDRACRTSPDRDTRADQRVHISGAAARRRGPLLRRGSPQRRAQRSHASASSLLYRRCPPHNATLTRPAGYAGVDSGMRCAMRLIREFVPAAGGFGMQRSRGAMSGFLLILLGVWGALIPFVGPYFDFAFTPDQAWAWTDARGWLRGAAWRGRRQSVVFCCWCPATAPPRCSAGG